MATTVTINARTAVAATAVSDSISHVYFQDAQNGIREAINDNGNWTISSGVLFFAKRSTPLAVISWDEGKQIRIYCVSVKGLLEEWCGIDGNWSPGYLTNLGGSRCSKHVNRRYELGRIIIRVYCQEDNSNAIQEYCVGNPWKRGATLPKADSGSNLAALSFKIIGEIHLRVYYQAPDLSLKEQCWDGSWSKGGFSPGVALKSSAIAATCWDSSRDGLQLRLFWQDRYGLLRGYKWSGSWESTGSINLVPVGTHISATNWNAGSSIKLHYQADDASTV